MDVNQAILVDLTEGGGLLVPTLDAKTGFPGHTRCSLIWAPAIVMLTGQRVQALHVGYAEEEEHARALSTLTEGAELLPRWYYTGGEDDKDRVRS